MSLRCLCPIAGSRELPQPHRPMPSLNPKFHPIIYVRGFAMRNTEIEDTINTPYMGFNTGSTRVRQGPDGTYTPFYFESPLIRLMKDYGYSDVYRDGLIREDRIPQKSIIIHRYYEDESGAGRRPSIPEAATALNDLVLRVRDQVCGDDAAARAEFKVYLVAHSMGGLICRCFLQNHSTGSAEARACVDKVFTYGTPHNGIEVGGFNVPRMLGLWDISNFSRREIADYLDLQPVGGRVNHLDGKFPPERFFSFVGTNHRDYNFARMAVGGSSDGLVKIENAYVAQGPRAHGHLSHSGHYGMVNSAEGYANLVRFLFGDVLAVGRLVAENLPLPPSVQHEREQGRTIEGSYLFECTVTPRGHPPITLSDRRAEMESAIFRTFDEMFHPDRAHVGQARHPILFSAFMDTSRITAGRTVLYTADISIRSTEFKVGGSWFTGKRVPDENLFRDKITIKATRGSDGDWNLRYTFSDEQWGENRGSNILSDQRGRYIPLKSDKGFRAKLYIQFDPWE